MSGALWTLWTAASEGAVASSPPADLAAAGAAADVGGAVLSTLLALEETAEGAAEGCSEGGGSVAAAASASASCAGLRAVAHHAACRQERIPASKRTARKKTHRRPHQGCTGRAGVGRGPGRG